MQSPASHRPAARNRIPARAAAMQMGLTYFHGIFALNTLCFINILLIGPGAGPTALNRPSLHCKYGPGGGKICPVRPVTGQLFFFRMSGFTTGFKSTTRQMIRMIPVTGRDKMLTVSSHRLLPAAMV